MAIHKISKLCTYAYEFQKNIYELTNKKLIGTDYRIDDTYFTYGGNIVYNDIRDALDYCLKYSADQYTNIIKKYYIKYIKPKKVSENYSILSINGMEESLRKIYASRLQFLEKIYLTSSGRRAFIIAIGFHMGIPYLFPLCDKSEIVDKIFGFSYKELDEALLNLFDEFNSKQEKKFLDFEKLVSKYITSKELLPYLKFLLEDSWYSFEFEREVNLEFNKETETLIVDYLLPSKQEVPNEGLTKKYEWGLFPESKFKKIYEEIIYSIVIRTLAEIFHYDSNKQISSICFNGKSKERNSATGNFETKYILSIIVNRESIESLDLEHIKPKECFKFLKGVSASKLYDTTEIQPIITPEFVDKRIIENRKIEIDQTSNIAEMDWEDFEHLVRQIFEWEFADKGGEVNVTQSSRDGGVDAIVFDPDPIRGEKIIIQAKRYTNTVPVSAVRDLYGTIINEGANKGILITTSDYGSDSYKFAQGKPITLLNGGHLLYLLEKHGHRARIDLKEAKEKAKSNL